MPTALITGITGQDGSFLAEFLLEKGYKVYGFIRRSSTPNTFRIGHLQNKILLIEGDLGDLSSMVTAIKKSQPDEIYNLAAQSFVKESWKTPYSTALVTALGVINCLEAIKEVNSKIKFYQAGSSEQFGKVQTIPQNESTPWYPRSPYGCSKVFAHEMVRNYRESYGLFACVGILFNHESERRGLEFVTRKITNTAAKITLGKEKKLILGNLDAKRDWGYSKDYVEAMWLMLQQQVPEDFVIGTGEAHSVKDFILESFSALGMEISFAGEGLNEKGYYNGEIVVEVSEKFFRPAEVDYLIADSSKARNKLNWKPKINFKELVKIMVLSDLELEKTDTNNKSPLSENFKTEESNENSSLIPIPIKENKIITNSVQYKSELNLPKKETATHYPINPNIPKDKIETISKIIKEIDSSRIIIFAV